jgi:hypothetical protein
VGVELAQHLANDARTLSAQKKQTLWARSTLHQ